MYKKFFNNISLFIVLSFVQFLFAGLDHQGLFEIMKQYKNVGNRYHFGNLFEHSTWVSKAIEQWFDKKDEWIEGLENYKRILIAVGFLHDIGKAGDLDFEFVKKHDHPKNGFEYLRGAREFKVHGSEFPFDFNSYFEQLSVSNDERKIIEILTVIHLNFGFLMIDTDKIKENESQEEEANVLFDNYLRKIENVCKEVRYNGGMIDESIVKMSVLIAAADWKGSAPVTFESTVFPELKNCEAVYFDRTNLYESKNRDESGKEVRMKLLEYFRKKFSNEATA